MSDCGMNISSRDMTNLWQLWSSHGSSIIHEVTGNRQKLDHCLPAMPLRLFNRSLAATLFLSQRRIPKSHARYCHSIQNVITVNNAPVIQISERKISFSQAVPGILAIFADEHELQARFKSFVTNDLKTSTIGDVTMLMHLGGKRSRCDTLIEHLPVIASKLELLSASSWPFRNIATIMNSMRRVKETDPGASDVIAIVTRVIRMASTEANFSVMEDFDVLMAGLLKNRCELDESEKLLSLLARIQNGSDEIMSGKAIAYSFFCMRSMKSNTPAVRELLCALTVQLQKCPDTLDAEDISNCLNGMQGKESSYREVCEALRILSIKIASSTEPMKSIDIANAMAGLNGISSKSREVRVFLMALTYAISKCEESATPKEIQNFLSGIRKMNDNVKEVESIIFAGAIRIRSCKDELTPEIGRAHV